MNRPTRRSIRTTATAVLCGLLICAALPPWGWWPFAFVGIAGWAQLLGGTSTKARSWRSVGVALGWFVPSLLWMASFSPPGFVATICVFAGMYAVVGVVVGGGPRRFVALPAAVTIMEWVRWHAPFGGVPLSSLSLTQASSPGAYLARVGGPLLITFFVTVGGCALAFALDTRSRPTTPRSAAPNEGGASPRRSLGGVPAVSLGACAIILLAVATSAVAPHGTAIGPLRVAVVQGGGPQGTLAINTDPSEPFNAHLAASRTIKREVDLVIWPENVVNVSGPLDQHPWHQELAAEARRIGAPIEVGVVEGVDDTHFANYSAVFDTTGTVIDRYDKVRRVPFGEYVPMRWLFGAFSDLLPRRDQIPGTGPAILQAGSTKMAVAISWEIFFPRRVREGVREGGEIVINPTNGSSYWLTLVQTQQLASSKLRALESGRYLLQAAPTGFSAIIDPDGTVLNRTSISQRKVLYATVQRRTGKTVAALTGDALPVGTSIMIVIGLLLRRRNASTTNSGDQATL